MVIIGLLLYVLTIAYALIRVMVEEVITLVQVKKEYNSIVKEARDLGINVKEILHPKKKKAEDDD